MTADGIAMAGWSRLATVPATAEIIDRFRAALAARDIIPPAQIIADGSIHRCDAVGKKGKGVPVFASPGAACFTRYAPAK
jgi:hypothetical protein